MVPSPSRSDSDHTKTKHHWLIFGKHTKTKHHWLIKRTLLILYKVKILFPQNYQVHAKPDTRPTRSRHQVESQTLHTTHLQFISFAIHLARLPKPIKIFKRPKNREDSSDFDDFRTKRIVSAPPISGKIFERTKRTKSFRKIRKRIRKKIDKCFEK